VLGLLSLVTAVFVDCVPEVTLRVADPVMSWAFWQVVLFDVACTVNEDVPTGVAFVVLTVILLVKLALPVPLEGTSLGLPLNDAVAPVGSPAALSVTLQGSVVFPFIPTVTT
jgi:hypothetical protein